MKDLSYLQEKQPFDEICQTVFLVRQKLLDFIKGNKECGGEKYYRKLLKGTEEIWK